MQKSQGLDRLGDAVDLMVMLEVLLDGVEERDVSVRAAIPGLRQFMKHLRITACEAADQLANELASRPAPREQVTIANRTDAHRAEANRTERGTSLAQRIQPVPPIQTVPGANLAGASRHSAEPESEKTGPLAVSGE